MFKFVGKLLSTMSTCDLLGSAVEGSTEISSLQDMFPELPMSTIQNTLANCAGSFDLAVDDLLCSS